MSKVKFQRATKSSRELRRIAQREQTREYRQAAIDAFWKLSPEERCSKVLNDVYDKLQFTLTSQEAIQEVYDTIGLEISFAGDVTEDAVTVKGA